ncbi:MAG: ABC transporter permease [Rubrobacteraceae bacterium]
MGTSFAAELKKSSRRPASWVIGFILVALITIFSYLLSYLFVVGVEGGNPPPESEEFLYILYPENFLSSMLQQFISFGTALALVLGALSVGSEYKWETLKLMLTQGPQRVGYFSGKLLALATVVAVFVLLSFAVGSASSYIVAVLLDAPVEWPPAIEMLKAFAAGCLILTVFATMGFFLATLFRGTSLAVGLGLIYVLVLENLFLGFAFESETVDRISQALPGRNAIDLLGPFREGSVAGTDIPGIEPVDVAQAALVLVAYLVVFVALSLLLVRSRDIS